MPTVGDTCLQDGVNGMHLCVVVYGPTMCEGYGAHPHVMTASITTVRDGAPHDPACVLQAGDHPFIHRTSYVAYRYLRLDPLNVAQGHVAVAIWRPHVACSGSMIARIRAGLCISRLASREFKRVFGCP